MTCIADYKTKKAFKEAVAAGADHVRIEDPSIVAPFVGRLTSHPDIRAGRVITVTNHPKRSWFASVSMLPKGLRVL